MFRGHETGCVWRGVHPSPPPIIENFPLLPAENITFFKNCIVLSGKFFCIPLYTPQSLVLRAATEFVDILSEVFLIRF